MLRRNNVPLLFFFLLTTLFLANSQANQPARAAGVIPGSPANPQSAPQPASQSPPANNAAPAASTGQDVAPKPAPNAAQNPDAADSGVFIFRKQVDEVVLHATVVDDKKHIVTSLDKGDFNVYENGSPQTITSFRHEDIPVAMGIVVDNSGSMREKRQKVNAAALNLVRASNSNDEVFIVNFNDEYYLDQDFTSNINKLKAGLQKRSEARKESYFRSYRRRGQRERRNSRAGGTASARREWTNRLRHWHPGGRRAPEARQTRPANHVRENWRHRFLSQDAGRS